MARLSKGRLEHIEKLTQEAQAFAPVAAAIRRGMRYSDLTEHQQDIYAKLHGFGCSEAYTELLLELAEIGVGEGLDEPLREPTRFRNEPERTKHIQKVAAEIKCILDGDADG